MIGQDLELRRREAEQLADAEFIHEREAAFLAELRADRLARVGPIAPDPRGAAPVGYARCAGCQKVFARGMLNTLQTSRPRGGGLEGTSHTRIRLLCGRCIVSRL